MLHQRSVLASRPSACLRHACGLRALTPLCRTSIAARVSLQGLCGATAHQTTRRSCKIFAASTDGAAAPDAAAAPTEAAASSTVGAAAPELTPGPETSWAEMRRMMADGTDVEVLVTQATKPGVVVNYNQRRGFMFSNACGDLFRDGGAALVGQRLTVKFVKVEEARGSLLFQPNGTSRPVASNMFQVGQVVDGTVESVATYGAFVDLGGGVVGVLHARNLSATRVKKTMNVVQRGMKIKALITSVNGTRIKLSTKELEVTPGDMLTNPQLVFDGAEEMGQKLRDRMAQEASGTQQA